jgi:hypothetical protein
VGLGAASLDERDDAFSIVAAIGDDVAGQAKAAEQGRREVLPEPSRLIKEATAGDCRFGLLATD